MRRLIILSLLSFTAFAAPLKDAALQAYFSDQVARIETECLPESLTLQQWQSQRDQRREELFEMLSLSPRPERSALNAVVTGQEEGDGFVVEKLHFQSLPGLYVTANFYRPKNVTGPLPTILYLCGHGQVKSNGVSYGNKTYYQHHGAWFARNGYACLTLDTIQLGEIEGIHHGTHRESMWWWNSRGYTPAGVEAWNCIRALDYLETRPEVDTNRFGVTGRSGGGAYSWWIAALDERIKVAAPVAGITDLRNHVVDGVVEGHCDCMFFVNGYRWDYPMVAALVAPRPLLLCNSDKDSIFPLDGVQRTHRKIARLYQLYNASTNLGLLITEGPHKDTQDLQLPVFRWFNRHLKREDPLIKMAAERFFRPEQLKVLASLPQDERTSRIHETFVPKYTGEDVPLSILRQKVFNGWPRERHPLNIETRGEEILFDSQPHVRLAMRILPNPEARRVELHVLDESRRDGFRPGKLSRDAVHAFLFVRGSDEAGKLSKEGVQLRRRYMLVGQTLDGMRVWDILRATDVLANLPQTRFLKIQGSGEGPHASNLMIAALFEQRLGALRLPPLADFAGKADYLNLLRYTNYEAIERRLVEKGVLARRQGSN